MGLVLRRGFWEPQECNAPDNSGRFCSYVNTTGIAVAAVSTLNADIRESCSLVVACVLLN